jgi:predicted alpha/beta hydrolase
MTATPTPEGSPVEITAADGQNLRGRWYPPAGKFWAAALIAPAMGVPQRFYAAFAGWLARQGIGALTFDYRGMGASRAGSLRAVQADILTWAEQDASAALAALRRLAPGAPALWIGHSLGGQIVPFVKGHEDLAQVITVAAGSGYWRENAPALKRRVWLLWWGVVPLLTPLFGYFPGKRLHMVGDLPRGVIWQWRQWCLHPEYVCGVLPEARARFAQVKAPVLAISFSDDEMMSERNILSLHSFYSPERVEHLRLDPGEVGAARVGHFGFFRAELEGALWEGRALPHLLRCAS